MSEGADTSDSAHIRLLQAFFPVIRSTQRTSPILHMYMYILDCVLSIRCYTVALAAPQRLSIETDPSAITSGAQKLILGFYADVLHFCNRV